MWYKFNDVKPATGDKIAIICDDGCSAFTALVVDSGIILEGECGDDVTSYIDKNSLWSKLPEDYELRFTTLVDERDWY